VQVRLLLGIALQREIIATMEQKIRMGKSCHTSNLSHSSNSYIFVIIIFNSDSRFVDMAIDPNTPGIGNWHVRSLPHLSAFSSQTRIGGNYRMASPIVFETVSITRISVHENLVRGNMQRGCHCTPRVPIVQNAGLAKIP
jgi:hypothetical protein